MTGKIVVFPDVNLIVNMNYARAFFTAMIPLEKYWLGLVTSYIGVDDGLISIFRKKGWQGLLIGFESVVQESQAYVRKVSNHVNDYAEMMKNSILPEF